jgi:hypothetical protein
LSEDWWLFSWRRLFEDTSDGVRETDGIKRKQLADLSKTAPKRRIREQILQDGSKVNEWGTFVYGYSMTRGAQIISECSRSSLF